MSSQTPFSLTGQALPPNHNQSYITLPERPRLGLIRTLGRAGIDIPQELSVGGYDDSHASNLLHIDLTTVRQNAGRIAEHAVRLAGSDDSTTTAGDPRKSP
jgi:DNA-binding LacI/PurR family transcriptional regulator